MPLPIIRSPLTAIGDRLLNPTVFVDPPVPPSAIARSVIPVIVPLVILTLLLNVVVEFTDNVLVDDDPIVALPVIEKLLTAILAKLVVPVMVTLPANRMLLSEDEIRYVMIIFMSINISHLKHAGFNMAATFKDKYPLYTSPALDWLNDNLDSSWTVFEYGGGGSTEYWSRNCAEVFTVDHSNDWYNSLYKAENADAALVKPNDPIDPAAEELDNLFWEQNFTLPTKDDESPMYNEFHGLDNHRARGYASTICRFPHAYFDVVVVDGLARSLCLWYAAHMIELRGTIILDNSCRPAYNDLQCWLIQQGFNRIDFWQPDHIGYCTSIFNRSFPITPEPYRRAPGTGDLGW